MGEEGTEKPQILVTLGLSSISGQCQHCQIWAGSCICVCISQILGTLGIICIVQGVKTELSWLFFAAVQNRLHKGTTRQWGQREHKELHWNMIVRTNPSCQCANHVGKCKIDPRSLMIPAAIHGKGTRDGTCLSSCALQEDRMFPIGHLWRAAPLPLLWAVPGGRWAGLRFPLGREGMGQGCPPASTGQRLALTESGNSPHPSSNALFGVQRISKDHREQWWC